MSGSRPVRWRRPWGAVTYAFIANAAVLAFLLAVLIVDGGRYEPDAELGWLGVGVFAWLFLRSPFVSVAYRGRFLVVRSWWWNWRGPVDTIAFLGMQDHYGFLTRSSLWGLLQELTVTTTNGRTRSFPAICGTVARLDKVLFALERDRST